MLAKNVGKKDFIGRITLGVVLILLGIFLNPWFYLIALVPIGTALLGYCPLYRLLGFSTCKVEDK